MTLSLTCPACRAKQDAAPACRRCKADLTLVEAVVRQAAALVARGRACLAAGDGAGARAGFEAALALDGTLGLARERALAALLTRDYAAAGGWYSAARPGEPGT